MCFFENGLAEITVARLTGMEPSICNQIWNVFQCVMGKQHYEGVIPDVVR